MDESTPHLGLVALDFYVPKQISYIWCMEATLKLRGKGVLGVCKQIMERQEMYETHLSDKKNGNIWK